MIPGCTDIEYCVKWIEVFVNDVYSEDNILPLDSPYYSRKLKNIINISLINNIEDLRGELTNILDAFRGGFNYKIPVCVVDPHGLTYDLIQNDVLNEMVKSPTIDMNNWKVDFVYLNDDDHCYHIYPQRLPMWVRCENDAICVLLSELSSCARYSSDMTFHNIRRKYMHKQMERYKTIDKHIYDNYMNHSLTLKDDKIKDYLHNIRINNVAIYTDLKGVKFEE